jgi:fructosamine-3-kinase
VNIPAEVREGVEALLGRIQVLTEVGGGCVHRAHRISTTSGSCFLKYGRAPGAGFFAAEAEGLRQLAEAGSGLRVPAVRALCDADEGREFGWLALEWLEPGRRGHDFSRKLAEGLAALHAPVQGEWGWNRDGFIGTLPQRNDPVPDWATFWRTRRLEPQLELARRLGRIPAEDRDWAQLLERLPEALAAGEADGASLLHGDLWGGNILATSSGDPAIVDPSAYRGHREVDLAMSELFGGFDVEFYRVYATLRPLHPGYAETRRGIYQLYYLLVHVNLFGDGYAARTAAVLQSVLASL